MGIFPNLDRNPPTQFWIAYRYLNAISLLIAPIFIKRQFSRMNFYEDTGMVTTLVKRLREKIEDDPSTPLYIETVRGVGYKFGTKCH